MTDQTARTEDEAAAEAEATTAQEARTEARPEPRPSTSLDRELADVKDRLLRTLAEMENLRKRTEREVADSRTYGIATFARDVLTVADNMHRAMEAVPPELRADINGKTLIEGVELTERELLKALEKNGVRRFEPQGEKFDPNVHQAMYEVPDASVPAGSVVQVVQAGYMIGDRVLRPALVGISKGGPKAAPNSAPGQPSVNDNATARES